MNEAFINEAEICRNIDFWLNSVISSQISCRIQINWRDFDTAITWSNFRSKDILRVWAKA
jgi:hypothetical protein